MFRRRGDERDRLYRFVVLSSHFLLNNERVKKAFYAVYCLGAIVGAFLRTPFGKPWALMLHSLGMYWLRQASFTVHRIAWVIGRTF